MNKTKDYLNRITILADFFPTATEVTNRVEFIKRVISELSNDLVPSASFKSLVFDEAEIIEIMQHTSPEAFEEGIEKLEELDSLFSYFRQYLQEEFGFWATITKPFINSLVSEIPADTYLELMAGNGYISKSLREKDKTVFATDSKDWSKTSETGNKLVTEIEEIDAIAAFDKYIDKVDIIILAWSPDFDEIDYQILKKYRKIKGNKPLFLLIGEPNGATNSEKFWNNVHIRTDNRINLINNNYPQYDIVDDKLFLID